MAPELPWMLVVEAARQLDAQGAAQCRLQDAVRDVTTPSTSRRCSAKPGRQGRLKKPIAVTPRRCGGEERYRLVCGQGRIEAFRALGQKTIPAVLMDVDDEERW